MLSLPEAHAAIAPPPKVNQLEAVVTATAEQLAVVGAEVQWRDFTLSRKFLDAVNRPEPQQITSINLNWSESSTLRLLACFLKIWLEEPNFNSETLSCSLNWAGKKIDKKIQHMRKNQVSDNKCVNKYSEPDSDGCGSELLMEWWEWQVEDVKEVCWSYGIMI